MGFLSAVEALGEYEKGRSDSPLGDESAFLEYPLALSSSSLQGRIIRVWLDAEEEGGTLRVRGVGKMDVMDYLGGVEEPERRKEQLLFKDRTGSNTGWSFAPVYRLGKGGSRD
ncbi:MAG: hypothetical protein K9L28_06870, partial [Synergistales bacterium]|nr:hypothetical protein [Synergistales bacterium]